MIYCTVCKSIDIEASEGKKYIGRYDAVPGVTYDHRCRDCGHRWQLVKFIPVIDDIRALRRDWTQADIDRALKEDLSDD